MRPTREGSRALGLVTSGYGFSPETPTDEVEPPTDHLANENARAWYPVSGSGSTSLLQDKDYAPGSSAPVSYPVEFDDPVTAGSLLIVMIVTRSTSGSGFAGPPDWTEGNVIDANGFNGGSGVIFHKIADGTEGVGPFTFNRGAGNQGRVWMAEFGGTANAFVDSAEVDAHAATTALTLGAVTPTNGQPALLIAGVLNGAAIASISTYTEIFRGFVEGGINGPYSGLWYKIVDPASGNYDATTTQTSGFECASDHLAFSSSDAPMWIPAPLTIDDDDATYHEVLGHTECWRGQLVDSYQVGSARLVIGCETAGSKSYDIEGQTLADIEAETGTVIGTFTFTATGSFTADTVEINISGADGYEYYRLIGPDETRHIFTVNLFSPAAVSGAELDDHISDPTDAHDASAVSLLDTAGWFAGTNVETGLAELAAKAIGYQAHGNTGTTETFDAATGWHSATLNNDCTFTLTAAPSGTVSSLFLELTQDGTGGHAITLPASVVNKSDLEADQDTTLSTTSFLVLLSRDGGTTWYGGWWGQDTGTGGGVDVEDEGTPLSTTATTLDFVGAGVTASGTGATKTITISGSGFTTPVGARVLLSSGDYTGTTGSFGDVTGATVTFTTLARRVRIGVVGAAQVGTASDAVVFDVTVDGTRQGGTNGLTGMRNASTGHRQNFSFTYLTDVLSSGSHTFKLQSKRAVGSGTITILANSSDSVLEFWAEETLLES